MTIANTSSGAGFVAHPSYICTSKCFSFQLSVCLSVSFSIKLVALWVFYLYSHPIIHNILCYILDNAVLFKQYDDEIFSIRTARFAADTRPIVLICPCVDNITRFLVFSLVSFYSFVEDFFHFSWRITLECIKRQRHMYCCLNNFLKCSCMNCSQHLIISFWVNRCRMSNFSDFGFYILVTVGRCVSSRK